MVPKCGFWNQLIGSGSRFGTARMFSTAFDVTKFLGSAFLTATLALSTCFSSSFDGSAGFRRSEYRNAPAAGAGEGSGARAGGERPVGGMSNAAAASLLEASRSSSSSRRCQPLQLQRGLAAACAPQLRSTPSACVQRQL